MSTTVDIENIGEDITETDPSKPYAEAEEKRLFEKEEGRHQRSERTQFTSILVGWMYIQKAIEIGQPTIKTEEPFFVFVGMAYTVTREITLCKKRKP